MFHYQKYPSHWVITGFNQRRDWFWQVRINHKAVPLWKHTRICLSIDKVASPKMELTMRTTWRVINLQRTWKLEKAKSTHTCSVVVFVVVVVVCNSVFQLFSYELSHVIFALYWVSLSYRACFEHVGDKLKLWYS